MDRAPYGMLQVVAAIALPSWVESVQMTLMANVEFIVTNNVAHPKREFNASWCVLAPPPPWHVKFKF